MNVTAIVPAFNEQQTIADVVSGLRPVVSAVLLIDDGSRDATAVLASAAGAEVIRHATNRGLGAAITTGIAAALARGADVIVTFDADGQMDPRDVPRLLATLQVTSYELRVPTTPSIAIGSRWLQSRRPLTRYCANLAANIFTYLLFGVWSTDTQSGLRAFTRAAAEKLELHPHAPPGMEVSSEIFAEIARLKLHFVEIPIQPRYTDYSKSKGQNFFVGLATLGRLFLRRLTR